MVARCAPAQTVVLVVCLSLIAITATAAATDKCHESNHNRTNCLLYQCQWNPLRQTDKCFTLSPRCQDRVSSAECVLDRGRCEWLREQRICKALLPVLRFETPPSPPPPPPPPPPLEDEFRFRQNGNLFVAICVSVAILALVCFCIITVDYGESESVAVHLKGTD